MSEKWNKSEKGKAYNKQYYLENKERLNKLSAESHRKNSEYMDTYNKIYYQNNKEQLVRYQRQLRASDNNPNLKLREEFLEMYGGKCFCCGEIIPAFLALDHIKGVNRRIIGKYASYKDAVTNYDPSEYRILCHNCNQATKGGNICPHQIVRNKHELIQLEMEGVL